MKHYPRFVCIVFILMLLSISKICCGHIITPSPYGALPLKQGENTKSDIIEKIDTKLEVNALKKILLIEDDLDLARELALALRKWAFEVELIDKFDDIVKEFIDKKPSLVLMDVNLPFYDGFYWCEKIRDVSKVPIIFLSSRDSNMDVIIENDDVQTIMTTTDLSEIDDSLVKIANIYKIENGQIEIAKEFTKQYKEFLKLHLKWI